jgi:hypothetical protein
MVNLKDVKKDRKNVVMSIRTTEEISRFMKDKENHIVQSGRSMWFSNNATSKNIWD